MSYSIVTPRNLHSLDELNLNLSLLAPFDDLLVDFLHEVSRALLDSGRFGTFPELTALGFWLRRSHIQRLKRSFQTRTEGRILLGRGTVFHIAPSNVDTIFVYSWFLSLLMGNSNIIRVSDRDTHQNRLLLETIGDLLEEERFTVIRSKTAIIRYGHDDHITRYLSDMADVRVIWGGDETIRHIRTIPIRPTATELVFADKFSFAVIRSEYLLTHPEDIESLVARFYHDAFWFGQMACSSIRMVVWEGEWEKNRQAQTLFWDVLERYTSLHPPREIHPADIVNKLVAEHSMAIEKGARIVATSSPYLNRIAISSPDEADETLHCGTGLFYELEIPHLERLAPHLTRKHQTLSHYGFTEEALREFLLKHRPQGIDRVVPLGKSLEFSPVWDGYDLFESFCREVVLWS
jgi:hypothetical protein